MSANLTKCAVTSMIIKSCYQPSIGRPDSKQPWDYEKKISSSRSVGYRIHGSSGGAGDGQARIYDNERPEELVKCVGSQTDYRESEAQTLPWEAPFKVARGSKKKPEILSLTTSTWGNGLPAGSHEVQRIQRMRTKRAWLEVLPPMDTPENVLLWDAVISAIEADEWAFREEETRFVVESQLELLERTREKNAMAKREMIGQRIERFVDRLGQRRDGLIVAIRGKFLRQVRKLNRERRGSSVAAYKLHRSDIVARYANPSSHLYAPEMRFGVKSQASVRASLLDKALLPEAYVDGKSAAAPDDSSAGWLTTDDGRWNHLKWIRTGAAAGAEDDLCSRRTRWTDEKLKKLHADLKSIRINETERGKKDGPNLLLKRKFKLPALPMTPLRKKSADEDIESRSCLLVQKITRGRAVQCMMFEGRDRCRELIEELKSTHSLRDPEEISHRNNEPNVFAQSRERRERFVKDNRLDEIVDSLEGVSVAGLLDTLSKEETRLREERKARALAMSIERERTRREAEEAGRRQLERNRRRELDEMFRQTVKVNNDTVQAYLEDVVNEEIETSADKEAVRYVEEIADEIDAAAIKYHREQEPDPIRDQEMIADMVHNFLLPEVNKRTMRRKIRAGQRGYLREAHTMIYNEIEKLMATRQKMERGSNESASGLE